MYYPYYGNAQMYNYSYQPVYWTYPNQVNENHYFKEENILKEYGPNPFVVDIEKITKRNNNYRTALWTGSKLQVTVMSLQVGEDIGLEMHPDVDQFLRIEQGQGVVQMGPSNDNLNFRRNVYDDFAIMVPAGTWHNLTNTGNEPLKLYTIYAPPNHPFGTVHVTKADATHDPQEILKMGYESSMQEETQQKNIIFISDKPVPIEIIPLDPKQMEESEGGCRWGCWVSSDGSIQCGILCDF